MKEKKEGWVRFLTLLDSPSGWLVKLGCSGQIFIIPILYHKVTLKSSFCLSVCPSIALDLVWCFVMFELFRAE